VTCHGDPEEFDGDELAIVESWRRGVHAAVGISCHDCHGGNPDPAGATDTDVAMDPDFAQNPFRDAPERGEIPAFCGRCHSDPDYMKRFRPDARVDQEIEYWTSFHGRALRRGDDRVATCVDCHGTHGILHADDPRSSVYPTRVAETCGSCHSDPQRMAKTRLAGDRPIPLDQAARWRESVHGRALMERGDLFAPTCNDCHGNHGAAPPGLESVTFVCGQCHGREASLLRASPKHAGLVDHNEFFEDDEDLESCASCHEEPDVAAARTDLREIGQCTGCHGNHSVARPTSALLATLPTTPCTLCHGRDEDAGGPVPEPPDRLANFRRQRDALVARADELGLDAEERFDWLVDRALELPFHVDRVTSQDGVETAIPRPEFGRLFERFRIGKTRITFRNEATGEERSERVRRCADCHSPDPELADGPVGLTVAHELYGHIQQLETLAARAERILLTARRGGIEVGAAQSELDQAVDALIQLQVLVHTFSTAEDSPFIQEHGEGVAHASAALEASQSALQELKVRRAGLTWSLVFIAMVLVGLGLKIRDSRESGH